MKKYLNLLALAAFGLLLSVSAVWAAESKPLRILSAGKSDAPVTIVDYASLTCSHCADFYNNVLPEIEKKYIETGKVKFIYRDFPLDGYSLKAAALVQCMPPETSYAFVKTLFKNMATWTRAPKPEAVLIQFAQMAGLDAAKATACMADPAVMDALIAQRAEATEKYGITATPTFIINNGEEKIVGAASLSDFSVAIDKILAKKK